jgi:hypothetical protein
MLGSGADCVNAFLERRFTKTRPAVIAVWVFFIASKVVKRTCGATVAEIADGVAQRIGPPPPSSARSYLRLNTPKG